MGRAMKESTFLHGTLATWLALCALSVSGVSEVAAAAGEGRFWLRSGDRFEGRIEGLRDGGSTLAARHPLVAEVLSIETAALARFEAASRPGLPLPALWQVELANGDRLAVTSWAWSAAGLRLETETAGQVTLPRAWLHSITRMGDAAPVLDGPGKPGDWKWYNAFLYEATDEGGLSFTSGRGIICREIPEMPDVFRLDMTIRYTGEANWRLLFYASNIGVTDVGGYALERSRDTLQLLIQSPAQGSVREPSLRDLAVADGIDAGVAPTLELRTDAVTLMFDRPRQAMRVFLNGEPIRTWTGIEPLASFGKVLSLRNEPGIPQMQLRDIRLAPMTAIPPDTAGADAPGEADGLWLEDGIRLTGTIEALDGDMLRLRTATGVVDVATEKILHLAFAAPPAPPAARRARAAVVALRDGSRITLDITGIEDGMLTGQSAAAGALRLRLADVREIEWGGDETEPDTAATGRFELSNGDWLSGTFERWDPGERVMRLRHPHIRGPLTVALSDLKDYTAGTWADEVEPDWRVELGAGDGHIRAVDLRLDEARFTLQTRYAGTLSVPREAVSIVSHGENNPAFYRNLDQAGWLVNDHGPAPAFQADGSGVVVPYQGYMSRALPELPGGFRIDIEIQAYGSEGRLYLLANRPGLQDLIAFSLDLSGPALRRHEGDARQAPFVPAQRFGSNRPARQFGLWIGTPELRSQRYTVLVDVPQRSLWVYSDSVLLTESRNVQWLTQSGRYFTIYGLYTLPFKVTDLRIAPWDGSTPERADLEAVTDTDVLYLRNGDVAPVRELSIDAGVVRVTTARLTLDIPVARVACLQLAGQHEPVDVRAMDMQLLLADGSLLRMPASSMTLDGTMLAGRSPSLGAVQMPIEAVRAIRWERYADRPGQFPNLVEVRRWPPAESSIDPPAVTIPYIDTLAVDADHQGWAAAPAYRIPENVDGAPSDRPEIRLAWNRDGLFVRIEAPDWNLREAVSVREIASGSSVEIYVASQRGSRRMVRAMISPGVDGTQKALRTMLLDHRPVRPVQPSIETVARRTADGYVVTARLPWRNLDLVVRPGDEIAVQCVVNRPEDEAIVALSWHPEAATFKDANRLRRVILGPAP